MKVIKVIVFLTLLSVVEGQVWSDESKFGIGIYVVVDDMVESVKFYEQLFQSKPVVDQGVFVGFRLSGGLFSLYSRSVYGYSLTRGNGVVPYIRVSDINSEFERVKALGASMAQNEVLKEGPVALFMFMDPSGNPLEFYSLIAP